MAAATPLPVTLTIKTVKAATLVATGKVVVKRRATRADRDIGPRKTTVRHTVISAKRDGFGKQINPGGDMVRREARPAQQPRPIQ